jgi:methionyl-tRNA formyltransferase
MGTPAFAVPTLEAMAAAGHEILAVYTQPDRPKGRGQALATSPVKEAALRLGLPLEQPERIRRPEVLETLRGQAPDVMVVVGYGQIIPQSIIDIPPLGIINVHGSLLPMLRGAGPLQWSLANGDIVTGVTTMRINAGLDTGDMLLKAATRIDIDENAQELGERLAPMGAKLLIETLEGLATGSIVAEPQNDADATYAPILSKEDGRIDWTWPAQKIHNRTRGFYPWPGTATTFRGAPLRLWKTRLHPERVSLPPGRVASAKGPVLISCGDSTVLELVEVQQEGRKRVSGVDFRNGLRLSENEILGE